MHIRSDLHCCVAPPASPVRIILATHMRKPRRRPRFAVKMVSTSTRLGMAEILAKPLRPFVSVSPIFGYRVSERLRTVFGQVAAHVLAQGFRHLHGGFREGFDFLVGIGRLRIPSDHGHHLFIPGQRPVQKHASFGRSRTQQAVRWM